MDAPILDDLLPDLEGGPFDHIRNARKRAWLTAYAITGRKGLASKAAGISGHTYHSKGWREDRAFRAAVLVAEQLFGDMLESEAVRRAVEGERRYKFDRGVPRLHPDLCECEHHRKHHAKAMVPDGLTGEMVAYYGPCLAPDCACDAFDPAPYSEMEKSDDLLKMLLKGAKPEKYAERVLVGRDILKGLDFDELAKTAAGQEVIRRLGDGENPLAVLATVAGLEIPGVPRGLELSSGVEVGGPGTPAPEPPLESDTEEA